MPADTSAAAADVEARWWASLSPAQRGQWWQRRQRTFLEMRLAFLAKRHPGANRRELLASVVEQQYGHELPPAFLQRAMEAIRNYEPGQPDAR